MTYPYYRVTKKLSLNDILSWYDWFVDLPAKFNDPFFREHFGIMHSTNCKCYETMAIISREVIGAESFILRDKIVQPLIIINYIEPTNCFEITVNNVFIREIVYFNVNR